MKIVIRTLALTLVVTGIAAGAYSQKTVTGIHATASAVPVPTCPLNTSGCGIWQ